MSPLETIRQEKIGSLGEDNGIPELNGRGCGVDRHCVFVKNGCHEKIYVVAHFEPMNGPWVFKGWWNIPGNSKKFIINDAKNAAIFFHAETAFGKIVWGDPEKKWAFDNGLFAFGKEIMPDNVLFYTMVFDCNSGVATTALYKGAEPVV
ncbi:hypothetical protein BSKO_01016 [Bryopsis sp. KO-2023]|nr:hypothetical protein BSKO_01016 [Bryopsis sp. KO-2023]